MIILGINAHHADASAAIVVDGKLVAAVEEERFRRIKHWAGFPERAIRFCLEEMTGGDLAAVTALAVARQPRAYLGRKALLASFDQFRSFEHRGETFKQIVRQL